MNASATVQFSNLHILVLCWVTGVRSYLCYSHLGNQFQYVIPQAIKKANLCSVCSSTRQKERACEPKLTFLCKRHKQIMEKCLRYRWRLWF